MQSKKYTPALLPQVEKVEILNLGDNLKRPMSKYISLGELSIRPTFSFSIYAIAEVESNEAAEIAGIWRRLPPAEQMRCHPAVRVTLLRGRADDS